jgi:hypothetical protein
MIQVAQLETKTRLSALLKNLIFLDFDEFCLKGKVAWLETNGKFSQLRFWSRSRDGGMAEV